jgi:hypothetical protein
LPVDDLLKRGKLNLDISWLKNDRLDHVHRLDYVDSLPPPEDRG